MPISADLIGAQVQGEAVEVTLEAVSRFAAAVEQPVCELAHEHVVPHTFPITILLTQMSDALLEAGIDWSRAVHGDQKFTYHRPIRIGDRLLGSTTIESVRQIAGNEIIGVRTEFTDPVGEAVVSCWSTIVERGEK
jgi:hypothetical protein